MLLCTQHITNFSSWCDLGAWDRTPFSKRTLLHLFLRLWDLIIRSLLVEFCIFPEYHVNCGKIKNWLLANNSCSGNQSLKWRFYFLSLSNILFPQSFSYFNHYVNHLGIYVTCLVLIQYVIRGSEMMYYITSSQKRLKCLVPKPDFFSPLFSSLRITDLASSVAHGFVWLSREEMVII